MLFLYRSLCPSVWWFYAVFYTYSRSMNHKKGTFWSPSLDSSNVSVESTILRIYYRASWSIFTVSLFPSKYGRSINTAHIPAKNARWVVYYSRSALFNDLNQYKIGRAIVFGCSWKKTHLNFLERLCIDRIFFFGTRQKRALPEILVSLAALSSQPSGFRLSARSSLDGPSEV